MKKTNPRSKQIIQILLIVLIVTASFLLFLYPETLKLDYKYSYKAIGENKEEIEEINQSLSLKELEISQRIEDLEELSHRRETLSHEKASIGVGPNDFVLDIPSFLITLEQKALSKNLDFKVMYAMKNLLVGNLGTPDMSSDDSVNGDESFEPSEAKEEEIVVEESKDVGEESKDDGENVNKNTIDEVVQDSEKQNSDISFSQIETMKVNVKDIEDTLVSKLKEFLKKRDKVSVEGMNITEIPIVVTGNFSEVRSYLKYLDEVGSIEPSSFNMISHGSIVSSSVILQIFHEEE